MDDGEAWPAQWLRGPLPMCVLRVLADSPAHGYAIARELEALGLGTIGGGTLYPVLNRLQRDGLLTAQWVAGEGGPGRKMYELTPDGAAELSELATKWRRFAEVTSKAVRELPEIEGHHGTQ